MKTDISLYKVKFDEYISMETYVLATGKDIKNGKIKREVISDFKDGICEIADDCDNLEFEKIDPVEALKFIRTSGTDEVIIGDDVMKNFKNRNFVQVFENILEETRKEEIKAELDRKQLKLEFNI